MTVRRDDRRRVFDRADGMHQLVLQDLGALSHCEDPAGSTEEGIVRDDRFGVKSDAGEHGKPTIYPLVAMPSRSLRGAEVDELVLAKRLHASRIDAWLVAKAVAED